MKIISLLQPWATLVVIGAKRIETRSWNTKYRGPLGIHASGKLTGIQREIAMKEPFAAALSGLDELPIGAIIGVVDLKDTFRTEEADAQIEKIYGPTRMAAAEYAFGDYGRGRYGWLTADPVQFKRPVRVRGSLGLWNFQICRRCGCTSFDCRGCVEKTGSPCHWVEEDLCSACVK